MKTKTPNHIILKGASVLRPDFLRFCVFIILIIKQLACLGQTINPHPYYVKFTVDEGLPSNEVYHVIQDSLGYIWLGTSNGVSRFDGSTFINYGIEDGILDNNIYELYIDYQGRIWFISGSGKLSYYQDKTIKTYPYNHKIKENIISPRGTMKNSFFVDSMENVHLSMRQYGRVTISPEGIFKKLDGIYQDGEIVLEKITPDKVLVSNPSNGRTYDVIFNDSDNPTRFKSMDLFGKVMLQYHFYIIPRENNTYYFSTLGNLFKVQNGEIISHRKLCYDIIWASIDNDNNLWVSPIEGGVYCFKNADFTKEPILHLFQNTKITSLLKDNENGYWFSSLNEGVFYCPNIDVLTVNQETGLLSDKVNTVYSNRQGLYIGYELGVVSLISKNRIQNFTISEESTVESPIRFIGLDSTSNQIYICTSNIFHKLENNKVTDFYNRFGSIFSYPRQIFQSKDGGFWIASSWGLKKHDGKVFTYDSRVNDVFSALVYSIYEDAAGDVWLCSVNGIWKFHDDKFIYLGDSEPYFSYPANYITSTNDGKILLGTKGVGLLIYNNGQISQITQDHGLAGNSIKKIAVDKSGIWVATNNGISWIKDTTNGYFNIKNFNTSNGLPTNDINDITIKNDLVYVASSKGLSFFNISQIKPTLIKPISHITEVRVNNNIVDIQNQELSLSHSQNFFSFSFIGLTYKNMGKVKYRYRMLGMDSTWVYTPQNNAVFSHTPPGTYTFEVQSQNYEGLWGDSATLGLKVYPPFWQTYWFILIATLVFSALIFLVYRVRVNAIRRRNKLINSANIYKQQSLRQQMNPHFIFNTLNSIQLYILEKDSISSHKYLTKFARLMRITLDNSQQSTIPLKSELEALNLYLELESLRLEGKFTYQIEVDNNQLLDQKVPTLLIQPFVENAIWHGIMLKEEPGGYVKISIHKEDYSIVCSIEDNGIGRQKAQEIKDKKSAEHKSLGLKITAQRIDLLNTLYKEKFNIQYFDLTNSRGDATGTKVQIKIPYSIQSNEQGV